MFISPKECLCPCYKDPSIEQPEVVWKKLYWGSIQKWRHAMPPYTQYWKTTRRILTPTRTKGLSINYVTPLKEIQDPLPPSLLSATPLCPKHCDNVWHMGQHPLSYLRYVILNSPKEVILNWQLKVYLRSLPSPYFFSQLKNTIKIINKNYFKEFE